EIGLLNAAPTITSSISITAPIGTSPLAAAFRASARAARIRSSGGKLMLRQVTMDYEDFSPSPAPARPVLGHCDQRFRCTLGASQIEPCPRSGDRKSPD